MKIGAQEKRGCSRRIGSVQKDSAVRAVARCRGTRRFATLHSACPTRCYLPKNRVEDVQEKRQGTKSRKVEHPTVQRGLWELAAPVRSFFAALAS